MAFVRSGQQIENFRFVGATTPVLQPSFGAAWANATTGGQQLSFAKSPSNIVLIEGTINSAGISTGFVTSVIFTLPTGYRPLARIQGFTTPYNGSTFGLGQFFIESSGDVKWNWGSVAPSQVSLAFLYKAEQ